MLNVYFSQFDTSNMTRGQIKNAESKLGYKIISRVLQLVFGVKTLPDIEISSGGKPYFTDGSFEFNIAHSHGRVVVAISDKPVGIDIESEKKLLPENICRRFFGKPQASAAEYTRFESYLKLTGEDIFGASFPPKEGSVFFRTYNDVEGYAISVCSPEDNFPESIVLIDP